MKYEDSMKGFSKQVCVQESLNNTSNSQRGNAKPIDGEKILYFGERRGNGTNVAYVAMHKY